ncbi:serine/arginine repetitive matrix protein 1-like [Agelaius tricolor]|uniref:serine/arginine repetitive matrix protein 1-like n=1 Tax=Agelaius tricolor TaxID=9191 RepID=UPI0039F1B4A3
MPGTHGHLTGRKRPQIRRGSAVAPGTHRPPAGRVNRCAKGKHPSALSCYSSSRGRPGGRRYRRGPQIRRGPGRDQRGVPSPRHRGGTGRRERSSLRSCVAAGWHQGARQAPYEGPSQTTRLPSGYRPHRAERGGLPAHRSGAGQNADRRPAPGCVHRLRTLSGLRRPRDGRSRPPLPTSPAWRWATPPPPWPGGTLRKHRNSDTRSSPNQTQAEAEAGPQEPERHKEKATRPPPHRPRRAKQDEDGPPNPQSPQKPTGLRPPAHRPEAGRGTPHRTKTQTPPPPRPRQKSFPGNSEGYKSQTPPKAPRISSTAPAAVPHLECNRQKGPP